jgi:hypothetical protein
MAMVGCFIAFTSAGVYTCNQQQQRDDEEDTADEEEPHNFWYFYYIFSSAIIMTHFQAYWVVCFLGWCASYHVVGTVHQEDGRSHCRIEYRADDDEKVPPGGLMSKEEDSSAAVYYFTFGWNQKLIRSWRDGDPVVLCVANGAAAPADGQATQKVIDLLIVRGYPDSARPCGRCAGIFWCPAYTHSVCCDCCNPLMWNCYFTILVPFLLYSYPYPLERLHIVMIIGSCLWIWPSTLYHHPIKVSDDVVVDDSYVPMTTTADDEKNPAVHSAPIGTAADEID